MARGEPLEGMFIRGLGGGPVVLRERRGAALWMRHAVGEDDDYVLLRIGRKAVNGDASASTASALRRRRSGRVRTDGPSQTRL